MRFKTTIKFKFTFFDTSTMETSHIGFSTNSVNGSIMDAWEKMGKDCFERMLILKTVKIEPINIITEE